MPKTYTMQPSAQRSLARQVSCEFSISGDTYLRNRLRKPGGQCACVCVLRGAGKCPAQRLVVGKASGSFNVGEIN